ncbi:MAG: dihydroneopterin aldolase [Fimbriimonadaceae bacterium]|nr:dihydroneopterin aldolase [Fimbriimonadaceae bacterium]
MEPGENPTHFGPLWDPANISANAGDSLTVHIRDLDVYAYHGVPDAEQAVGHRYRVDLDAVLAACPALETDRVAETLDYGLVGRFIAERIRGTQFRTLERLADDIADRLMREWPYIRAIRLSIRKPLPPAPIIAREVGITLSRVRRAGPIAPKGPVGLVE